MGEGLSFLGYIQNLAAILKATLLDQSQMFCNGKGVLKYIKEGIVPEIDCYNQTCNISCGSKVISTESKNFG